MTWRDRMSAAPLILCIPLPARFLSSHSFFFHIRPLSVVQLNKHEPRFSQNYSKTILAISSPTGTVLFAHHPLSSISVFPNKLTAQRHKVIKLQKTTKTNTGYPHTTPSITHIAASFLEGSGGWFFFNPWIQFCCCAFPQTPTHPPPHSRALTNGTVRSAGFTEQGKTKHLHHCRCNHCKTPRLFVDFLFIK